MEHRHLRFFVAVAEELHFTRAAARLRVAQPHLSHEIRRLEREIGVELFVRSKRRVVLSPAGQVFLERVRFIFHTTDAAIRAAQRASRGEVGRLTVGFNSAASYVLIPNAVARFRRDYPEVDLRLIEQHSDEAVEAVRMGQLDVCLAHPPRSIDVSLVVETVIVERLVLAVPTDHPLARLKRVGLRQLSLESWVLWHREIGSRIYDEIVGACAAAGFEPRVAQFTSRLSTVISLVGTGMGIALVPVSAARLPVEGVEYRDLRAPRINIPLSFVTRSEHKPPALAPFMSTVRDCGAIAKQ